MIKAHYDVVAEGQDALVEWRKQHPRMRLQLSGADLRNTDLSGMDLSGANLSGANLYGSDLHNTDLSRASLHKVDFTDAYMSGANLTGADLTGATAEVADCTAEIIIDAPAIPNIDGQILQQIALGKGHLDMDNWHSCKTTHCRAGWATTLAGKQGELLESVFGPDVAGQLIYKASRRGEEAPNFYVGDNEAMEDMMDSAERHANEWSPADETIDVMASTAFKVWREDYETR